MQQKHYRDQRRNHQKNIRKVLLDEIKLENEILNKVNEVKLDLEAGGDFAHS